MPKVQFHQHALNAGEFSPLLYGRVDIPKYQKALKTGKNVVALVQGGVRRRMGTRIMAEALYNTKAARLIPYVLSRTSAFVVEFGDLYARYYSPSGQVLNAGEPLETATPYTAAQVADLRYAQSSVDMVFTHQSHAPRRLTRKSATVWTVSSVIGAATLGGVTGSNIYPYDYVGERSIATTLTLNSASNPTTGTGSANAFTAADVGREIVELATGARVRIAGYSSATGVTFTSGTTEDGPFSSTVLAGGAWMIVGPLNATITPSATGPEGAIITLTAGANCWKDGAFGLVDGGSTGHIQLMLWLNGGLVQITSVSSLTSASAQVIRPLASTTAVSAKVAEPMPRVWAPLAGYPKACAYHNQRLAAANTQLFPLVMWMSEIGTFGDFRPGVEDDEPVSAEVSEDAVYSIEHMATVRDLVVLGSGSVLTVTGGGTGEAITPSAIKVTPQSPFGAGNPRPVRIGNELIYVQAGDTKLRSIGYNFDLDAYNAPEVSILSEHLLARGVKDMAYQQLPESVVWLVMKDGTLVSCAFDRDQDVIAFTQHDTDGVVESVAVIPDGSTDQVWLLVNRTVDGMTRRFVEVMDQDTTTDCAISGQTEFWSSTDKSAGVAVSGATVTASGTNEWVRSQTGYSSGKRYFEVVATFATSIGISKSGAAMGMFLGDDAGEVGWTDTQIFREGTGISSPGVFVGSVVGVACDFDAGTVVFYKNGTLIATVTGISAGTWYATAHGNVINAAIVAPVNWQHAPSGYEAWWPVAWMFSETYVMSQTRKSALLTVVNSTNTTITHDATPTTWAQAFGAQSRRSGKLYYEAVVTASAGMNFCVGVHRYTLPINSIRHTEYTGQSVVSIGYAMATGQVIAGGGVIATGAALAVNDVLGVALDVAAGTVAFYKNNVLQATVSLGAGADPVFLPAVSVYNASESITLRFRSAQWSYAAPSGFVSWDRLDYLNGKTVDVIGDGVYQGQKTVSQGAVTIDTAASDVEFGLHFEPEVHTLTPEVAPGISGTQAMATSINRVWLRVKDSEGDIKINGQTVTISAPGEPYSGDVDVSNLGWSDGDGSVLIEQEQPYPLTLLAIIKSLTVNQG